MCSGFRSILKLWPLISWTPCCGQTKSVVTLSLAFFRCRRYHHGPTGYTREMQREGQRFVVDNNRYAAAISNTHTNEMLSPLGMAMAIQATTAGPGATKNRGAGRSTDDENMKDTRTKLIWTYPEMIADILAATAHHILNVAILMVKIWGGISQTLTGLAHHIMLDEVRYMRITQTLGVTLIRGCNRLVQAGRDLPRHRKICSNARL